MSILKWNKHIVIMKKINIKDFHYKQGIFNVTVEDLSQINDGDIKIINNNTKQYRIFKLLKKENEYKLFKSEDNLYVKIT